MEAKPAVVAFDAYGTLLDVLAIEAKLDELWPGHGPSLAGVLRAKQLEYAFLHALMRTWKPFRAVTADALRWAVTAAGLEAAEDQIAAVLGAYDTVGAYPDAEPALRRLAAGGRRAVLLTNGSTDMVTAAARAARLDGHLEAILSVDAVRTFKPDPTVYALVEHECGVGPEATLLVSSNPFDVCGAAAFGFRTCWVRRRDAPFDVLGQEPSFVVRSLAELADLLEG